MNRGTELYLEVEDTCVAISEILSRRDHPAQESRVQSEGGSGRKKPTVTWEERGRLSLGREETEGVGERCQGFSYNLQDQGLKMGSVVSPRRP